MRKFCCLLLLCLILPIYGQAQIKFKENKGQWEEPVRYKADVAGGSLFITKNELRYHFRYIEAAHHHTKELEHSSRIKGHSMFIEWLGASDNARYTSDSAFSEYYNYFIGRDQSKWQSGVKAYAKVRADNLYDGIDMLMESKGDYLKVTYFVQPGISPNQIKLKVSGAEDIFLQDGNLHIKTSLNEIIENAPVAFQTIDGIEKEVPCHFRLQGDEVSFEFPEGYPEDLPLIIDPTLIFATYSGSVADNFGFTATYDYSNHAYTGGTVYSTGFPIVAAAYDTTFNGGVNDTVDILGDVPRDAGILKFSPDGSTLLWATYLGGSNNEQPHSMVVDSSNNLVIYGTTHSKNFPVTSNAYDTSFNGGGADIYVAKLSSDGKKLLASTYIGGSAVDGYNGYLIRGSNPQKLTSALYFNYGDQFRGEVIGDKNNNIYVASCTYSKDFPVSAGAFQTKNNGKEDAVIFKLDSNLSSLSWSTYAGGKEDDAAFSLQIDKNYNVFAAGGTNSPDSFFTDNNAYLNGHNADVDGFVIHLKNDGTGIINGTYVGTSVYDQVYFVQLDENTNVYVYGQTRSDSYPVVNVKYKNAKGKQFITKFKNDLSGIIYSTTFGSGNAEPDISPTAFLVDECQKVFISGWGLDFFRHTNTGLSSSMPLTSDALQKTSLSSDLYLAVFSLNIDTLLYATFMGGDTSEEHVDGGTSRFDKRGVIYQAVCAGCGGFSDFPVTSKAWSTKNKGIRPGGAGGGCNNLVLKMDLGFSAVWSYFNFPPDVCVSDTIQFKNESTDAISLQWDFGDSTTSTELNPKHKYKHPGVYNVRLIATNLNACNARDTLYKRVVVYHKDYADFTSKFDPCKRTVEVEASSVGKYYQWYFGDNSDIDTGAVVSHEYEKPGTYKLFMITDSGTTCADTLVDTLTFIFPYAAFQYTIDSCEGIISFENSSLHSTDYIWEIDTMISTEEEPAYYFGDKDFIEVALTSIDSNGCSHTSNKKILLPDALIASFDIIADTCSGDYSFINTSQGADRYIWDLGDSTIINDSDKISFVKQYDRNDSFTVTLVAVRGLDCADTFTVRINYKLPPQAGFTFTFDSCTKIAAFQDSSVNAEHIVWKFGDGVISAETNPTHKYHGGGKFRITQLISSSPNCIDSFVRELIITDSQKADFGYYQDSCTFEIQFIDKSVQADSLIWDFGGGVTSNLRYPSHNFGAPGTYPVKQIINPGLCADTITKTIMVEPLPIPDFVAHQDSCDFTITFENTSFRAFSSFWDFDDGAVSTDMHPIHTYADTGNYNVRLIINSSGCPDTLTKVLRVDEVPAASFSYTIDTCNLAVSFTDNSSLGNSYIWDFDDGSIDTVREPVHKYLLPGDYTVKLVINKFSACTDTFYHTINIPKKPNAYFKNSLDTCSTLVKFFDSSFRAGSYKWDFGDGNKGDTVKNPEHRYEKSGFYTVRLVINPGTDCEDTFSKMIFVYPDPMAEFNLGVDTCRGQIFTKNNSVGARSYLWELSDGRTSTASDPRFAVEDDTSYTLKLTINPGSSCAQTIERSVKTSYREANFTYLIDSCSGLVFTQNLSRFASSYYWDFGNGKSSDKEAPVIPYTEVGDYDLRLIINPETACADTFSTPIRINVPSPPDIIFPNVFTPNDDGYNDVFKVSAPLHCEDYEIKIYNRWGQLVHEDKAEVIEWDGSYRKNGQPLPDGTYYYIFFSARYGKFQGTVTILR